MTSYSEKALLPPGFHDVLPQEAAFAEHIRHLLISCFHCYGYDLVMPPLMEFEASLLSGPGEALAEQTFRLMDPVSHQMMGIRADMTMQIARIASTRLKNAPLPLRLSYSGQVVRIKGTPLYGERQLMQAGIELIGTESVEADVEVISVALQALKQLGLTKLSLDLSLPRLLGMVLAHLKLSPSIQAELKEALIRKQASRIKELSGTHADVLLLLSTPTMDIERITSAIEQCHISPEAISLVQRLKAVIAHVKRLQPDVTITLDALEYHGFEYHTGIGFAIFATDTPTELGKGGRYRVESTGEDIASHEAVGFTLYINNLTRILPPPPLAKRLFIPYGTHMEESAKFHQEGIITIHGLEKVTDNKAEARKHQCDAVYEHGQINPV